MARISSLDGNWGVTYLGLLAGMPTMTGSQTKTPEFSARRMRLETRGKNGGNSDSRGEQPSSIAELGKYRAPAQQVQMVLLVSREDSSYPVAQSLAPLHLPPLHDLQEVSGQILNDTFYRPMSTFVTLARHSSG